jgi:miniconductance mechanosensitive channel
MQNSVPLATLYNLFKSWLAEVFSSPGMVNMVYGIAVFLICLAVSILFYRLGKYLIFKGIELIIKKRDSRVVVALKHNKFFSYLSYYLPLLVFKYNFGAVFIEQAALPKILGKAYEILAIILFVLIINSTLNTIVYLNKSSKHSKPIRGLIQFIQIIIYFFTVIIFIAVLLDKSPTTLMAGLGAASAIIMLIFKDGITSLVAGVQLSFNHMIQIGDWVSLPKYDVDGEIYDITLTSVKIRNWDKSVSTVPTYNLVVSDSVRNWRYMKEFGARRISRAIIVDVHSVRLCTPEMFEKYRKVKGVEQALVKMKKLDDTSTQNLAKIDTRGLTNLGIFRAYVVHYLSQKEDIRKDLDIIVKQRGHLVAGLPIEVYCFANTTDTVVYENIQSDIFDHLLAIVSHFDLKLFQTAVSV